MQKVKPNGMENGDSGNLRSFKLAIGLQSNVN